MFLWWSMVNVASCSKQEELESLLSSQATCWGEICFQTSAFKPKEIEVPTKQWAKAQGKNYKEMSGKEALCFVTARPKRRLLRHDLKIAADQHSPDNLAELEKICIEEWKRKCEKKKGQFPLWRWILYQWTINQFVFQIILRTIWFQ